MATSFSFDQAFAADPATVLAMLRDPAYVQHKAERTGGSDVSVEVTANGAGGFTVTCNRVLPAEPERADERLRSLPGIGIWTSAEVRARALGDADALSLGDYNVPRDIGWALVGQPLDDAGLAELLEPYRPHRLRVQRLIGMAGIAPPRHGPRLAPRTHLP